MRSVHLTDLLAAARVVHAASSEEQQKLCAALFREAEIADRYTRRMRRPHPQWGNGTLKDAARRRDTQGPHSLEDAAFCEALIMVLARLKQRPRAIYI